ncbi:protein of unknown function [Magnetospirillum gryphiswaldense MSR-1 v2]|uniref:Uncharacterized protein n=1 Tax=Magnetospirillum gryphiswaldense (strain DSM 6361 / JCM 21280 / NBRC 15271 / MSR-1) TaxID=431944 RepID=V6F488_MAGGM|nr:protein of unknown function [Magnetospirillum gryphiswaldense MSR-1 v2]
MIAAANTMPVVGEGALLGWLDSAAPGELIAYHEGHLVCDRTFGVSQLPDPVREEVNRVALCARKHLQHAPGKTVIFVGVLEKVTDEFNAITWQPQMEGSKAGRELPGIVDQVISMHLFSADPEGNWLLDEKATERRLVRRLDRRRRPLVGGQMAGS